MPETEHGEKAIDIALANTFHDVTTGAQTRELILAFEHALSQIPGAVFGDSDLCPLKHSFAPGMYVREIYLPKGTILTGKLHRHEHPNFLMQGEVIVVTESGGREHLTAPRAMISPAGTKRAVVALEDTIWVTVHLNEDNTRDLALLEERIIAPSYDVLEAERALLTASSPEEEMP